MGIFGFGSKKNNEKLKRLVQEELLQNQQKNLENLAKGSQMKFAIPYFHVFDPRFENFAVPVSVHGALVYAVHDINRFNSINKTEDVSDEVFMDKLRGQVTKYIKSVVTNAPADNQIQVMQMERKILEISKLVQAYVTPKIEELFGINIRSLDITQIAVDTTSRGYRELKAVTTDLETESMQMRTEMQRAQLGHQKETMRIQREELQRASRLQTETNFLSAHQADLGAQVQIEHAHARMFAPQMPTSTPPMPGTIPSMPGGIPQVQYMVGINGQQAGPYNWMQLQQLVEQGQLTQQTYVWKQGMANWELAGQVQELLPLFASSTAFTL